MDYIFLAVLVALAAYLLVRRLRRNLKGESTSCCGGQSSCCSCDSPSAETPSVSDDRSCGKDCNCSCSSSDKGTPTASG